MYHLFSTRSLQCLIGKNNSAAIGLNEIYLRTSHTWRAYSIAAIPIAAELHFEEVVCKLLGWLSIVVTFINVTNLLQGYEKSQKKLKENLLWLSKTKYKT